MALLWGWGGTGSSRTLTESIIEKGASVETILTVYSVTGGKYIESFGFGSRSER